MKVDERVNLINSLMKEQGSQIFAGEIPDMSVLEKEISEFIKTLGQLPVEQVRDYSNLVNIWAVEVKNMSDKLGQIRAELQKEMGQSQTHTKAHMAYASANKPSGG